MAKKTYFNMYFGHPTCLYDTEKEQELLTAIRNYFPKDIHIENPNQTVHKMGYTSWKRVYGDGIKYFREIVLPKMHGGVFTPFEDGKFGYRQINEIITLHNFSRPLYEITLEGIIKDNLIENMTSDRWLSSEETRNRIDAYLDE